MPDTRPGMTKVVAMRFSHPTRCVSLHTNHNGEKFMAAKIHQFPCLQDNFGVLIHDPSTGATAVGTGRELRFALCWAIAD